MALSSIVKHPAQGFCAALLCAGLFAFGASANDGTNAPARSIETFSPTEMRIAAENALLAGYSKAALAMTQALLVRNPDDLGALLMKSRAQRNLGAYAEATQSARHAWRLADTDQAKFAASMAVAQALSSDGKRTRAQLWLRQAADIAPDENHRAVAARDFRYVRARNPLAVDLRFNIRPTNNINNGSEKESTPLFGLPFEFQLSGASLALEGVEYSAGVSGRYRFSQSANQAHDLTFQSSYRTYTMTNAARARAPGVSGSDFAFGTLAVGYAFQRTPKHGLGPYGLGITAGQTWYSGAPYNHFLRLGASQSLRLGDTYRLNINTAFERQFSNTAAADADTIRADLSLARALGKLGSLSLSFGHTKAISPDEIADFNEWRGGVDFAVAKPILGTQIAFGLALRKRDYDRSRYDPAGRHDTEFSAHADMVFTNLAKFGFNPTLRIEYSNADSNIGLFETNQLGVQFGLRSAF